MRIFIGLVVLALAVPASAALVNGNFETGDLTGWSTDVQVVNPTSYVPDPDFMDGSYRAGDSNCNARDTYMSQEGSCPVNPAWDCYLIGYLAGGDNGGYTYYAGVQGGGRLTLSGVNNWQPVNINIGPCIGQSVVVEVGSTGDGTWGAVGYHVDVLDLVCIPEPVSLALLGLAGLPLLRRRR